MKIALAQLNYHIGNFESNTLKIILHIEKAKKEQADLVVFSELAVCGYPPLDFLEFDDFMLRCKSSIDKIALATKGIAVIIGAPSINPETTGRNLFNSAYFISEGKILGIYNKGLLPNYDVFDEYRYFEPAKEFKIIPFKGKNIALTICEDLWNIDEEKKLYQETPMEKLIGQNPDLMINIAASPFSYSHSELRKNLMRKNAERYKLPLFYVNQIGAQTELIFDGNSLVYAPDGHILDELALFKEDFKVYDLNALISDFKTNPGVSFNKSENIYKALVLGVKDYFEKTGFSNALLGLSGGIDSALTLVIAAEALGAKNVRAILMPSMFSSEHSVQDAVALAKNLGCPYETIGITDVYNSFTRALEPQFKGTSCGLAEENLQARIRGVLLMAISNKFGSVLLNTSNKSEMAVGYGTLYGDMCGGLSVLGDVYKTEVFELAAFINLHKEIIPNNTIIKPPSAELKPDQKDIDSLPPYEILDQILYDYIENKKGPKEIINSGYNELLVTKILKMVNTNEYKRKQAPPILRISNKAFGPGRRMPIVGKYLG
ncbi:MAG: NAD+ synthase [Bacteroidetes bacterium]|nr:NAD+ synthase [Bacteroidota bacterium]HET6245554.1 NAD+ synthase [Bacteroidia bacterium]